MSIDINKVQKLIEDTIGSEYKVHETHDTPKYIFINWKHKTYELDDERGILIGAGPIAFNKTTGEYKLLGSGDIIYNEEYRDYLFENSNDEIENDLSNRSEIKEGILRRKFVNNSDIFSLSKNFIKISDGSVCHLSHEESMDYINEIIVCVDRKEAIQYFIDFWIEIGYRYKIVSENELFLRKIPD